MNLGKQATDLCSSSFAQVFVAAYFAHDRWQGYLQVLRDLYRRRRDTMLDALAECLPREASWTRPQGGLFIWATLPDYIDTTDLLALALSRNVAFVPGRAAYLDGRGGSSMRLNFSGVDEHVIREGVRRIGEVVREQLELYGALHDRAHGIRLPGRAGRPAHGPRAGPRARGLPPARLPRLRAGGPHARGAHRRALRAGGQRDPRAHRDEPAPAGGRRRGDGLRRADRPDRRAGARGDRGRRRLSPGRCARPAPSPHRPALLHPRVLRGRRGSAVALEVLRGDLVE